MPPPVLPPKKFFKPKLISLSIQKSFFFKWQCLSTTIRVSFVSKNMTYPSQSTTTSTFSNELEHLEALLAAAASSTTNKKIGYSYYEIRQCLRQIQAFVMREEGERLYEEEENEAEVTRDLMKLLTLNYEYDDPMTAEMMNILIPRAAELISCHGGNLNTEQLTNLLSRILYFIQEPEQLPPFLDSLLALLNQHLTPSRLPEVLDDNDLDCWIALQYFLNGQQQSVENVTHLSIRIFTLSLLEHLATYVLPRNQDQNFQGWLRCQLMQQQTFSSPQILEGHVQESIELIQRFGEYLVEDALHLLERGLQCDTDGDETILQALQQSTVATNFVSLCLSNEEFSSFFGVLSTFSGMAKSLWQSLATFIAEQMENNSENISEQLQMAATEALWHLTLATTTNEKNLLDDSSSSLIVLTVLRLLQYPDAFWTFQVQEWLKDQLSSTPYCRSLFHALQATIVSQLYYYPDENQQEHISSFIKMVMYHCDEDDELSDDPWQSLVNEYLSDHLMLSNETP